MRLQQLAALLALSQALVAPPQRRATAPTRRATAPSRYATTVLEEEADEEVASGEYVWRVEAEAILGPQPTLPDVGPAEVGPRMERVFQAFIRVLATTDHPVVLFLDDLQWVDSASLGLLENLLAAPDGLGLYVIGAYRNNEVEVTDGFLSAPSTSC